MTKEKNNYFWESKNQWMGAQNQVKRHISKKENFFSCQCEFGKEGTKRNFYPKSSAHILG